jgi:hypothetical protein
VHSRMQLFWYVMVPPVVTSEPQRLKAYGPSKAPAISQPAISLSHFLLPNK